MFSAATSDVLLYDSLVKMIFTQENSPLIYTSCIVVLILYVKDSFYCKSWHIFCF
jgi:hypothetical protein